MKKIIGLMVLILSIVVLSGCAQKVEGDSNKETTNDNFWGDIEYVVDFELNDMNENLVNNSVFRDYKYTLINMWGTFCNPCIEEIPALQELYEENKDINIIGIAADGYNNEIKVFEILNQLEVGYTNLIPNKEFIEKFLSKLEVVPVSIIVDSDGKILETIVGSKTKAEYEEILKPYTK